MNAEGRRMKMQAFGSASTFLHRGSLIRRDRARVRRGAGDPWVDGLKAGDRGRRGSQKPRGTFKP